MEVVVVHPMDPFSPAEGGSVRYALNLVRNLEKQGKSVTVLGVQTTPQNTGRPPLRFVPILRNSDDWIRFGLGLLRKLPFLDISKSAVILTLRLDYTLPFVLLKPDNPKIMVSDEPLHYARLKFGKLFPLVAAMYHLVERYCMARIDVLITDSKTQGYYLDRYPGLQDKVLTSHTAVDLETFRPLDKETVRVEHGFEERDPIIAFVGRLAPVKNIEFLIRSFTIVKEQLSPAKLVIVGRGEPGYEMELRGLVDELAATGVTFTGEIHPDRVPTILNCADVLALCSLTEGSPTVVKEALACGVPVVSTDIGDVKTVLVNDLTGKIVQANEQAFAQALIEVLRVRAEKSKEVRQACTEAASRFGLQAFGEFMSRAFEMALVNRERLAPQDGVR